MRNWKIITPTKYDKCCDNAILTEKKECHDKFGRSFTIFRQKNDAIFSTVSKNGIAWFAYLFLMFIQLRMKR